MLFAQIQEFHTSLKLKIEQLQSVLILSIVYIVGIGATALIGKLVRKEYVSATVGKRGTWSTKSDAKTNRKMY